MTVNRLSAETHALARRVLSGEWGGRLSDAPIALDGIPDLDKMPAPLQAAHAVRLIAEQAPLRIDPCQQLIGGATLYGSTRHKIPVYLDGRLAFQSISHLTAGFDHLLTVGYRGLRAQIDRRIAQGGLNELGHASLDAMRICVDAAGVRHRRHMDKLAELIDTSAGCDRRHYVSVRDVLSRVPESRPRHFGRRCNASGFRSRFSGYAEIGPE